MATQHNDRILTIGDQTVEMPYRVRKVIEQEPLMFVLLAVPNDVNDTRNVYGYRGAEEVWQVQGLDEIYPDRKNLPFEDIRLTEEGLAGADFYGRRYLIDPQTGRIVKQLQAGK